MFDFMMSDEHKKLREEARELVRWVPRQMILDMDQDNFGFPGSFCGRLGRRNIVPNTVVLVDSTVTKSTTPLL